MMKKILAAILSAMALSVSVVSLEASATTVADVIAYARSIGMPEDMVQSYIAMGSGMEYTSEQCDKAIAILSTYEFKRDDAISGGSSNETASPDASQNTTPGTTQAPAPNGNPSDSAPQPEPVKPEVFENMELAEKKDYITSIPKEDKQEYLDLMTNEEKNQLLKELEPTQQAEVISSMLGFGEAFGYSFSIEDISDGSVIISARDESEKLVGVTVLGDSVEKTGIPYTLPVLSAVLCILLSAFGIGYILRKCR
ncbi:MAG: hypothetical protein MJ071_02385 [Oscillospiraceae bacterium]|nr:hypothetical protein [Oscillospiraceae bacterium]